MQYVHISDTTFLLCSLWFIHVIVSQSGPDVSLKAEWGVNYRALNDLFEISQSRKSSITYEIGVQMVEIYNEQVRDLLSSGGLPKRYPTLNVLLNFHICFLRKRKNLSFNPKDNYTMGRRETSQLAHRVIKKNSSIDLLMKK